MGFSAQAAAHPPGARDFINQPLQKIELKREEKMNDIRTTTQARRQELLGVQLPSPYGPNQGGGFGRHMTKGRQTRTKKDEKYAVAMKAKPQSRSIQSQLHHNLRQKGVSQNKQNEIEEQDLTYYLCPLLDQDLFQEKCDMSINGNTFKFMTNTQNLDNKPTNVLSQIQIEPEKTANLANFSVARPQISTITQVKPVAVIQPQIEEMNDFMFGDFKFHKNVITNISNKHTSNAQRQIAEITIDKPIPQSIQPVPIFNIESNQVVKPAPIRPTLNQPKQKWVFDLSS